MFNALTGLGGGGQMDAATSANSNAALYGIGSAAAFFSGSVCNILGPRLTLQLGTTAYPLLFGAYLAINIHPGAGAFVVTAGAILGVSSAFLWTAQGSLMLAYATEAQKGTFIASPDRRATVLEMAHMYVRRLCAWSAANIQKIGFLVLSLSSLAIPILMVDPGTVIRADGSRVVLKSHPSWRTEIANIWRTLRDDPAILLLFPMFFASNYFYIWQFNDYNSALFDIRARALNNLVHWLAQIFGSIAIGTMILDNTSLKRRSRAYLGWGVLVVIAFGVHGWATYTRASIPDTASKMDIYDEAFPAYCILMASFGLFDALWQTTVYWLLGAISNDAGQLAIYVGFYKSIQSAGGAGAWRADAVGTSYMNMFASTWALSVAGLIFALPMIYVRVKDESSSLEADKEI
ncbi:hypothetical protein HYDPIDRAFT_25272 [Hydnomerulius pinastri MD-312]|nr:hypothetical protein HYDPIDRAFT_25272 [Hydnomerulius pinastri MD-312]